MSKLYIILIALFICSGPAQAQKQRKLPEDTAIASTHEVTIEGQRIRYKAIVGTQPVYGKDGKPNAALFYTYYKRTGIKDTSNRPILIAFNGGPGAAELWMHLGYFGPKRVKISRQGFPVQPYGVGDNHHSLLDEADLLFISPVNTGFSRILNDGKRKEFFGVNADIKYLADWIDVFISRHGRWESPKFLIGESYGTPRVAGLAGELQNKHWMYLDGVILESTTSLGLKPEGPWPYSRILNLPHYTAVAWYYKKLPSDLQSKDLADILPKVENFTINKYLPAMTHGGFIKRIRKQKIANQIARYSGLPKKFVLHYNLAVPSSAFGKELLRSEGYTLGQWDARYKGIDTKAGGDHYHLSSGNLPAYAAWKHAYTPAINHYLRENLGFKTDLQYYVKGPVFPWSHKNNHTGEMLRHAMIENPDLHVMFQAGYYDNGLSYFQQKYVMWNLDPSGKMRSRLQFKGYRSGHMIYARRKIMIKATDDLRRFIKNSIPKKGKPAKY